MRYALNTVPVNGWLTYYGEGTADVEVDAEGSPTGMQVGGGTADVTIDVAGQDVAGIGGAGVADVRIDVVGKEQFGVGGSSAPLDVAIDLRLAIPRPGAVPAEYRPAHASRVIRIGPQSTAQRIASPSRTHRVPPEVRTLYVTPERDS